MALPVFGSQLPEWPKHSQGTHLENGPPLTGSRLYPAAHDSQNCPTYPSGQLHCSIHDATSPPSDPSLAVSSLMLSIKPTPKKNQSTECADGTDLAWLGYGV